MEGFFEKNKRFINKLTVIILILASVYILFEYIFSYIAPFVTAFLLSLILEPFIRFMVNRMRLRRWVASTIAVVFILSILSFIVTIIIVQLVGQAQKLIANFPLYLNDIQFMFEKFQVFLTTKIDLLPEEMKRIIFDTNLQITETITKFLGSKFQTQSFNVVATIPGILMFLIVTVLSTFFLCKDKNIIAANLKKQIPKPVIKNYYIIKNSLLDAILGYGKAQLILMTITGSICIISLTLLKSDYSLLIGLLIAFIDALPIFGSGFILWPRALISAVKGDYRTSIWLLATYLIVLLARQLLEPKVLGKQIGIHPLLTLFSVYIGLKLFGAFGLILGPMCTVIIKGLFDEKIIHFN